MRIGHGFDVHELIPGFSLKLCGIKIPHTHTLKAHSDGDVAIHAICDALLGAAALGDIGRHFPDTNPEYSGIDSQKLLNSVNQKISEAGYKIINIDVTIIAQAPKLSSYMESMRENITTILKLNRGTVNIKATTTEGLGYCGRKEGIATHSVALITSKK